MTDSVVAGEVFVEAAVTVVKLVAVSVVAVGVSVAIIVVMELVIVSMEAIGVSVTLGSIPDSACSRRAS